MGAGYVGSHRRPAPRRPVADELPHTSTSAHRATQRGGGRGGTERFARGDSCTPTSDSQKAEVECSQLCPNRRIAESIVALIALMIRLTGLRSGQVADLYRVTPSSR